MDDKDLKLYILIHERVEPGFAIVAAAHAAMVCERSFGDTFEFQRWKEHSFRKVVCKVNDAEWANALNNADRGCIITESALGNAEVAIVFNPRFEWPKAFKFLKKWR